MFLYRIKIDFHCSMTASCQIRFASTVAWSCRKMKRPRRISTVIASRYLQGGGGVQHCSVICPMSKCQNMQNTIISDIS